MILLGSYICYTTNTLDAIEAFIAETYVQLVATESMCYSFSSPGTLRLPTRMAADGQLRVCKMCPHCTVQSVPYIAACVDISGMVLSGPFRYFTAKVIGCDNINATKRPSSGVDQESLLRAKMNLGQL